MSTSFVLLSFVHVCATDAEQYSTELIEHIKGLKSLGVGVGSLGGRSNKTLVLLLPSIKSVITRVTDEIIAFLERNPGARLRVSGQTEEEFFIDNNSDQYSKQKLLWYLSQPLKTEVRTKKQPGTIDEHLMTAFLPSNAVVQIFYATDRQWASKMYGRDRGVEGGLSLGTCEVSIPRDHRLGKLESPSIWRFEFRRDPEKHVVLLKINKTDDQQFWSDLSSRVNKSKGAETFVFVHGYNTTFEDAARRTAQIAYDLAFDGAPICYSWPSQGELADYPKDETNAQWTVLHLKNFLQTLAQRSGAGTIHVIAHSMGNRAVSHALQLLSMEVKTRPYRMRHLVLTAPDIDADTFTELAGAVKSVSDRVTLYISRLDKALELSKRFHGYSRLGEIPLVVPGIDTIDASAVDTSFLGHSYYGENRSVLSDIFWLLKDGKPPGDRFGMKIVQQGAAVYYAFRP
jgi:esterase/lipase superfamily enzyme